MCVQSQIFDTEGLCESPHDSPPKWALMLTAYLDESFQSGDGYAVMAGFFGNKDSWQKCAEEWRAVLGPMRSLHMNKLRWKGDRHKTLLERLGAVPHSCGLQPVFASVRLGDYKEKLKYPGGPISNGYFVTCVGVAVVTLASLPKGERVELLFEQQLEHAMAREYALYTIGKDPRFRTKHRSALAKSGSIPKSVLLEPSDYLAYAIMQTLVDPESLRARLCAPILRQGKKRIGGRLTEKEVRRILKFKSATPLM